MLTVLSVVVGLIAHNGILERDKYALNFGVRVVPSCRPVHGDSHQQRLQDGLHHS